MNQTPSRIITGAQPGNVSAILVGVHGNELAGVHALEALNLHAIEKGEVRLIVGNPKAIAEGVRFTERNLNRLFRAEHEIADAEKQAYEYARSREILRDLEGVDALLDIHASNSPESEPFCICEPHAFSYAKAFPTRRIVSGFDALEPGGSDEYMNRQGGMGICFETGYLNDPLGIERAKEAILAFLILRGHIEGTPPAQSSKEWIHMESLYHTKTDTFEPEKIFADFEEVTRGQCIGRDGGERVLAEDDGVVLFVRPRKKVGDEAFLFGKKKGEIV
jgi:succinylglutamate desuccinylase